VCPGQRLHGLAADQAVQVGADPRRAQADRHVADLAGAAAGAAQEPAAAQVDGEAEAEAQPDQREAVGAVADAVPPFGDGRQVDVVVDRYGDVQAATQTIEDAGRVPARHVDVPDHGGGGIVGTGHAHLHGPHAREVGAGLGAEFADGGRHRVVGRLTTEVGGRLDPAEHGPGEVADGHGERGDAGFAHRHADGVRGGRVGRVDLGLRTGTAAGAADDDREAVLGQAAQDLRGGGLGQAGEAAQVATGQRPMVEQVLEAGAHVHRAQQLRRPREPVDHA
jgi:hypothetical protein